MQFNVPRGSPPLLWSIVQILPMARRVRMSFGFERLTGLIEIAHSSRLEVSKHLVENEVDDSQCCSRWYEFSRPDGRLTFLSSHHRNYQERFLTNISLVSPCDGFLHSYIGIKSLLNCPILTGTLKCPGCFNKVHSNGRDLPSAR